MGKKFQLLLHELKNLITKPVDFFTKIAPKKTFKQAFLFDLIQTYVGFLPILLLYSTIFSIAITQEFDVPLYYIIIGATIGFPLLALISKFVTSFISFIILKIAGGKGTYLETYKVNVYAGFPTAVGMFFFIVGGGLLQIYSCVLQVIGYARTHKISYWRGAIPLMTSVVLSIIAIASFFIFMFSSLDQELTVSEEPLVVGGSRFGQDYGNGCMEKEQPVFTNRETLCLDFLNVSGFEQDENNLSWYDIDVSLENSGGVVTGYSAEIYGEDGIGYLKDGILDQAGVVRDLDDLSPGKYLYSAKIYDRNSGKGTIISQPFRIKEYFGDELTAEYGLVGYNDEEECVAIGDRYFSYKHNVCLEPVDVRGFDLGNDGLHWFEMDFAVRNEKGEVVDSGEKIWGEEGHFLLENNFLSDHWVYSKTLPPGTYSFELLVYDKVSHKQIFFNESFTVGNWP